MVAVARRGKTKNKPKATTPWAEILHKYISEGASGRALSREYGVPESTIRARAQCADVNSINDVANQIVTTNRKLKELSPFAQGCALDLAARLSSMQDDVLSMAQTGAKTGKALFAIAALQASKINREEPLETAEALQALGILTKLGNEQAAPAIALLNANKAAMEKAQQDDARPEPRKLADFYAPDP